MNKRELAKSAHKNYETILHARSKVQSAFLDLGEALAKNEEHEYWSVLGHDSFEEFLATPELAFKRSTAFKAMGVWRVFRKELKIDEDLLVEIGIEKLDLIRKVCSGAKEAVVEEWLAKAQRLARADLKVEVKRLTGGAPASTEEEMLEQERTVARTLKEALEGATVTEAEWTRSGGIRMRVMTKAGAVAVRVWGSMGTKAEVTPLLLPESMLSPEPRGFVEKFDKPQVDHPSPEW